jgi:hypothetical protein
LIHINTDFQSSCDCFNSLPGRKSLSYRVIASLAAVAMLGTMCVSTDALARGGGARGGGGGGRANVNVNRNVNVNLNVNVNRGVGYGARGVGVAVGAAAVGAAAVGAAAATCGYFPYPACY